MSRLSAGLLMYRTTDGALEVLLVHPGGPYWSRRDDGSWSIPKGEYAIGEEPLVAAIREFREELGLAPPADAGMMPLGEIRQPSGKVVSVWAVEGNLNPTEVSSNTVSIEWPRSSGSVAVFPEVDRACWFSVADAKVKLLKGQLGFLDLLVGALESDERMT